jgi:prepilin-type processing-associated H-X9-DG protein
MKPIRKKVSLFPGNFRHPYSCTDAFGAETTCSRKATATSIGNTIWVPSPATIRFARGFTLAEILVVFAIIISLVAVLLVAVRSLRGSADKVTAIRNISQLHVANAGYAAENNGRYVPVFTQPKSSPDSPWFANPKFLSGIIGDGTTIKDSTKQFNTVPHGLLDPVAVKAKGRFHDMYSASFGYVDCTPDPTPGNVSWSTGQVVSPEKSAAFISATDFRCRYPGRTVWKKTPVEGKSNDGKIAYRHKGDKAVVVYYDGHVGEISMKEILQIDSRGGASHPFWNAAAR